MFENFNNIFFKLSKKKRIIYFLSVLTISILEFLGLGFFLPVILSILDISFLNTIIEEYDLSYLSKLSYKETITFFLFLLLGFYFFKSLISTFLKKKVLDTLAEFELDLSKKLFNNFVKKDLKFHIINNSAELIRDIQMISTIKGVLKEYFTIFTEILLLFAIVIALFFFYSADILIVFSFVLFFYLMFFIVPKKKLENIGYSRMVADGKSVKDLKDSFFAIKLLRLHNIEDFFVEKFAKSKKIAAYTDSKRQFINILPGIWIEMVFILSVIIIILFTINYNILNLHQDFPLGQVVEL